MQKKFFIFILFALFICSPAVSPSVNAEDGGRGYYDMGVFAYEDGDYEDAESNFQKALSFNPDNPKYNHYMGKNYIKMEQYEKAMTYLGKAVEIDSTLFRLKHDIAMVSYHLADYSQASDLFIEILKDNPEDSHAAFYAGLSLFKQERYSESLIYFNNAAEISELIKPHALYYAGISYIKLNKNDKALETLRYVTENADSESLREYALKWLENIKSGKEQKPYSFYVKLGYQYDDNTVLESPEGDTPEGKDDFTIKAYASLDCDFLDKSPYKINGGYSHYQTWHNEHSDLDMVAGIFKISTKYRFNAFSFGINYIPSLYAVDSKAFLMRHQLMPEFIFPWRNFITRISYSFYDNNYEDDDSDGNAHEVNLDIYYNIADTGAYIFGGIGYEDNSASHPDKYYEESEIKLGISFPVPWDANLSMTGKYFRKDYDNIDRKDDKYYGAVSLSRNLYYEWLKLSAEFDYTNNDSSDIDYKYERNTAALSCVLTY